MVHLQQQPGPPRRDGRHAARQAGAAEVDRAMAAATAAKRDWARTPAHERGAVLLRAAAIWRPTPQAWGLELAREEGKTAAEGDGEVLRAAQILRYYGNEGDRAAGEVFSSPRRGEQILVTRKPLGVVGVVTPFNFPIAIPAWKIAPALAYGNTVVWKPASTVPLLAMRLAQALDAAGLAGRRAEPADRPGLDGQRTRRTSRTWTGLTFTGSTGVGRRLAAKAAGRGVPVQAEMGGKNAAVVLADADLDLAAEQVLFGAFRSTGQKCTATSRLIVARHRGGRLPRTAARTPGLLDRRGPHGPGRPDGPGHRRGRPQVHPRRHRHLPAQGARVVAGGGSGDGSYDAGTLAPWRAAHFVAPTVLELPATDANTCLARGVLRTGADAAPGLRPEEAFALANDSEFGLSAAVFTQDITRSPGGHRRPGRRASCTSTPNPPAPTRTCPSAGRKRAATGPKSRAPPPRSSSRTPPPCT